MSSRKAAHKEEKDELIGFFDETPFTAEEQEAGISIFEPENTESHIDLVNQAFKTAKRKTLNYAQENSFKEHLMEVWDQRRKEEEERLQKETKAIEEMNSDLT